MNDEVPLRLGPAKPEGVKTREEEAAGISCGPNPITACKPLMGDSCASLTGRGVSSKGEGSGGIKTSPRQQMRREEGDHLAVRKQGPGTAGE